MRASEKRRRIETKSGLLASQEDQKTSLWKRKQRAGDDDPALHRFGAHALNNFCDVDVFEVSKSCINCNLVCSLRISWISQN